MKLGFDLVILGDPASGKDTQAGILKKRYGLVSVESGEYLRKLAKTGASRKLKGNFALGHPAPVKIIKNFILKSVRQASLKHDLVFVGNPRLKPEAVFLKKLLDSKKRDFFVFYIKVPGQESIKRSIQRVRMPNEDNKRYIRNRINYTKRQVSKTVNYFRSLGRLKVIDGNQPIKKVSSQILIAINDYKKSRGY